MKVASRSRRARGVALVFALFTIAILITMSATVVALAIRHGRTGSSTSHAEGALHAANWGLEATINYMGVGGPTGNWEARGAGYKESYHLKTTTNGAERSALGGAVKVRVTTRDDLRPAGSSAGDSRLVNFLDPTTLTDYGMTIDGRTQAKVEVLVTEYRTSGQPSHYQLTSTARVVDAGGNILATRVVEARIREQAALDFLHFIQNAQAWDVNGVDAGSEKTKDIVGLPEGYREQGKMRIDGGGAVASTAGTLKFYGRGDGDARWKFSGEATIARSADSIRFTDSTADRNLNTIFSGGLKASAQSLGMPQKEGYTDYARSRTSTSTLNISINGDAASAFTASTSTPTTVPDVMKASGNDARPSFAKIVVTLNGGNVTVEKVNPALPGRSETLYSGSADGIGNGLISVRGGNVEVQSARDGAGNPVPFVGNLTIVSDENTARAGTSFPQNNGTIYADAARTYYDQNPHDPPPYTERKLFGTTGSTTRYVWPPPPAKVEREGNTFVTGDIKYGSTGTKPPALGMVSQNFILLNDKQADNTLQVDGVLMSLEHSVQFDWDNMAGNPNHSNLLTQGVNRTFKLNGSIVGGFLDVEGDASKRGYYTQDFTHDENLRFNLPPSFPRWDRTVMDTGGSVLWNWVMMNYVDKGTLNRF